MNNMTPKSINRIQPKRKRPRYCEVSGCDNSTREGKPYCTDHVMRHPYVKMVAKVIEGREREILNVAKRGHRAVDVYGSIAQEIVSYLKVHGTKTIKRIARDHGMKPETTRSYCDALRRAGIVILGCNKRGNQTAMVV